VMKIQLPRQTSEIVPQKSGFVSNIADSSQVPASKPFSASNISKKQQKPSIHVTMRQFRSLIVVDI
jgi:hypothetical protein